MVPEKFSYQVLPHFNDRYALFNQGENYELISNICLHRQEVRIMNLYPMFAYIDKLNFLKGKAEHAA